MKKIKTIYKRDFNNNGKITKELQEPLTYKLISERFYAVEKLDGTNVRVTVRNGYPVRLEKRKNPNKAQKQQGIENPWYIDADRHNPQDKYIYQALDSMDFSWLKDGEYSAEAYGEKIQGNPLNIEGHKLFMFTLPKIRDNSKIDTSLCANYEDLKNIVVNTKSTIGNGNIEGLVFYPLGISFEEALSDGHLYKIKAKDYK